MTRYIINELHYKYPYKRIQIISSRDKCIPPPNKCMFNPNKTGYIIEAELDLQVYKNIPTIYKLLIYNMNDSYNLISLLLAELVKYNPAITKRNIYTTKTQYIENNLQEFGFIYDEKYNMYYKKVVNRQ
mgnify:CR=1 FL=1